MIGYIFKYGLKKPVKCKLRLRALGIKKSLSPIHMTITYGNIGENNIENL